MEEEFIPYKEALELKELGFEEVCFGFYVPLLDNTQELELKLIPSHGSKIILAPLYQQAFKWFRRKYQLGKIIETLQNGCGHRCSIIVYEPYHFIGIDNRFDEYEDAELHTLRKMIELAKTDYKSKFFINPQIN